MSTDPAVPGSAQPAPATEYDRFLAALPESFRNECRTKLKDSNLGANEPVFLALAELYENENRKPAPNYIAEVTAYASQSTQLLAELKQIPASIMGTIQPQLLGLLSAWNDPLQRLETTSLNLQRNLETLPGLLVPERTQKEEKPMPKFEKRWDKFNWWLGKFLRDVRSSLSDRWAWIVTGSVTFTLSFCTALTLLFIGATHVSHSYEQAYQERLGHMEADSAADTVALNQLLAAGIALKVEQGNGGSYFLILPGAHKAAQPVNSPEGLAVEVWP